MNRYFTRAAVSVIGLLMYFIGKSKENNKLKGAEWLSIIHFLRKQIYSRIYEGNK